MVKGKKGIITDAKPITEFDVVLYFALVEKMTVYDGRKIIVSLLDGTEVECEIEEENRPVGVSLDHLDQLFCYYSVML